ncbi:EAL domain-containing protein [Thiorhodococcus mannitoliphagus]|uniref:EAL domain-containing protein n=1 Tax=Thiorhodococcus mannitoliphagus TaxID=329406 RepID=A0A6P1E1N2_9GAMM|nr:GGDEF and EAL domain-containing protein [Thiorhodococcus mannitoliphagus]NEX22976.1 EAL domain-containing protein [Thiorhodococcus mannitoliphagus]
MQGSDDAPRPSDNHPTETLNDPEGLRRHAEDRLRQRSTPTETSAPEDAVRLLHELLVHQIELEIQNEELRRAQAELEASKARYFDLYDLAPVGYLTLSEAWLIEEANLAAASLLDQPRAALVGQSLSNFIYPEDQDIHYRCRLALRSTKERQRCELRLMHADHQTLWVMVETSLAPQTTSGCPYWQSILIDITARKQGELALLEAQARLRLVTEIAELTFWEWNPKCDRISVASDGKPSPATPARGTPTRLAEWAEMLHPEDRPRILASIHAFVEDPQSANELQYRICDSDSGYRWLQTRLEATLNTAGQVDQLLLVHQDVTRRKASEDQAVRLAQHDPLTGLPARILLDQLAEHMIAGARRAGEQLAVLFFDLDRFKAINDLHGHDTGDQVLKAAASRLRATFREEDLVCRMGGDEFVVVLSRIRDADEAAHMARKVIAALSPPYDICGLQLKCTASLGISLFPRDGDTLGELLQRADIAMYQAKKVSPGHYQFVTAALNRQVEAARIMEQRLRQALEQRELCLVYQPLLNVDSGRVEGVEALLRWPQPEGTPIPPETFLPVAESIHLIHDLGHWVLREAFQQQVVWQQAGLSSMPISVNISTRQFYHPKFIDELTEICRETAADPQLLTLQMSQATLLENRDVSLQLLDKLKALGVKLVMDDFGLGCASLCELGDLPLDGLSINRVLVQRLHIAQSSPAILDTIIHLGRALALQVTAVGIESASDLSFIRERDCDWAQGYYLGEPMSGAEFVRWYQQRL